MSEEGGREGGKGGRERGREGGREGGRREGEKGGRERREGGRERMQPEGELCLSESHPPSLSMKHSPASCCRCGGPAYTIHTHSRCN